MPQNLQITTVKISGQTQRILKFIKAMSVRMNLDITLTNFNTLCENWTSRKQKT